MFFECIKNGLQKNKKNKKIIIYYNKKEEKLDGKDMYSFVLDISSSSNTEKSLKWDVSSDYCTVHTVTAVPALVNCKPKLINSRLSKISYVMYSSLYNMYTVLCCH